jgi:hypothetical protein
MLTLSTRKAYSKLNKRAANPFTKQDVEDLDLVPFTFVGGPADGQVMLDSEKRIQAIHDECGEVFDPGNPSLEGPNITAPCRECGTVVSHAYVTNIDRHEYFYWGECLADDDADGHDGDADFVYHGAQTVPTEGDASSIS